MIDFVVRLFRSRSQIISIQVGYCMYSEWYLLSFVFLFWIADTNGNWMGSPGFRYSNVLYQLHLNGFSISDISQYEDMMKAFKLDIICIGNMAKSMNLAFNLLLWTTYNTYYSLDLRSLVRSPSGSIKGGLQQFQMTGDAKQVFDLKYQAVRVMSFAGFV